MPSNLLVNTAEGGSNGTTVTTGNSGGASGPAFDSVTAPPVDAILTFDNTHVAHGSLAYEFQIGATSTQLFLQWLAAFSPSNVSYAKISFNSYWTANPAASAYQLHVASAAAAQVCGIRINTSGQLFIVNQAGTNIGTMTSAIPLNAWFRVEVDVALDSTQTVVNVTCARFDNIDSGQATDQVTGSGVTAVPFSRIRFGWGGSATTNNGPWWMDDLQVWVPSSTQPTRPGQTWERRFKHRQVLLPGPVVVAGGNPTGDVSATVTETDAVTAVVGKFGAVTATVTAGGAVTTVVGAIGAVTATVTSGSTVAAAEGAVGAVTATITCGSTVAAVVGVVGAVSATVTCGSTVTASTVSGLIGTVSVTVTSGSTVTAVVGKVGTVTATVTAGSTFAAVTALFGSVTTTVTSGPTVTGVVGEFGAATSTVTAGSTITGIVGGAITPTPTPAERILTVAAEARTAAVPLEDRVAIVPVKPDTATAATEPRTLAVPAESRTDTPVIE